MALEKKVLFEKGTKGIEVKAYGCRTSFAYLNTPDDKNTYRAHFLLPKNTAGIDALKEAILAFGRERFPGQKWACPAFKDGDGIYQENVDAGAEPEAWEHYKGMYVLAGKSYADKKTGKAPDVRGDCYSGAYVAALLNVSPYDNTDDKGTRAFGLHAYFNGVVFQEDGDRLGGVRKNADALGLDPLAGTKAPAKSSAQDEDDTIPF